MLYIRQVKHLARSLGATAEQILDVANSPERFCEELILRDPAKPDRPREVLNVTGHLRRLQDRLYRRILLPKLARSSYSHGGVPGRSARTNAAAHLGSRFLSKTDVSNFYPSIHRDRVYRLFADALGCSPDVARICTKLCTYSHHLALGLVTSPILADRLLREADSRIGTACDRSGLVYTRFVDDITISGSFDLRQSGFGRLVQRILSEHGFLVNVEKNQFGRLSDGIPVTGIRVVRRHLDVTKEYAAELWRQLDDAENLANGATFIGPYYMPVQIGGRVRFVSWVNPGRRNKLMRRCRAIPWDTVQLAARERGLIATKKVLEKAPATAR